MLVRLTSLVAGLLLSIGMLMIDIALEMSDYPNIWTDGSREDFSSVGGFEVAGAGVYLPAAEVAFESAVWGVAAGYGDARLERCRAFMPVPGVMQTVQQAEFWSAILALQAYWPCHLGIDNLNVARTIGRLLDRGSLTKPLLLVKGGDLVALAQYMIRTRGRHTVRVTKVTGHATDVDVDLGRVRTEDRLGIRRLILLLILVGVISRSCPLMLGVACLRLVLIGIL